MYRGCAAEHSSLFGQVYLAATRWPDGQMDDRVSNYRIFCILMSSSEISFNNYLLCNLTINIKMSNCHTTKFGKNHKMVGKGRDGTTFWCIKRNQSSLCSPCLMGSAWFHLLWGRIMILHGKHIWDKMNWGQCKGGGLHIYKPITNIHAVSRFEAKQTWNGGELGLGQIRKFRSHS